jgi:transcriptional regulator with XRE-family HTH domain
MIDNERLGRMINVLMAEQRMGRRELAKLANLSYPYLSELCRGLKAPSFNKLISITDALGVTLNDFIVRAEDLPELKQEVSDLELDAE